ncbi:MAG TPA: class I SAM-dependent methyltransferase [Solirubrobacteraceae bacterium]|jgi:SAM-dependent methyltransferase|nr:class I SAM-dependent methyltransferase [Solirubrobacteraceae bacterium]
MVDALAAETSAGLEQVGACPACGSARRTFAHTSHDWIYQLPGTFALQRCDDCRCVYPDPRPSPAGLGAYYPEGEYYAYSTAARHELFARRELPARAWYAATRGLLRARYGYAELGGSALLGNLIRVAPPLQRRATFSLGVLLHPWRPGGALLDVGCGAGGYLDLMRALGWAHVAGVDISARGVETARDALGIEAHQGDLAQVGFDDETFDAVSLSHTLEHIADPVALLREVRRVTRPGGRIAILVPNVRSMLSRLLGSYWLCLDPPRHLVNFSPAGLRIAIERSGLELESLRTWSQGATGVAAFSVARWRGDPHGVYTNSDHPFGPRRRAVASTLAGVESALCALGVPAGEQIGAVARR